MKKLLVASLLLVLFAYGREEAPALSMRTYKQLTKIENLIKKERFGKAEFKLNRLLNHLPRSPVDRAYIYNSAGIYYLQKEKYAKARELLLLAYGQKALSKAQTLQLSELIGNLYMHESLYAEAIDFYTRYLAETPDAPKRVVMACGVAYYQTEAYGKLIDLLEKARKRFKPDENLFRMLFAAYYELEKTGKALDISNAMVRHWPDKREYWLQLGSLYYEQDQTLKALESIELAYYRGVLEKESDYLQYVYLLLDAGLPDKAAKRLERLIKAEKIIPTPKNRRLLTQCKLYARELPMNAVKRMPEHDSRTRREENARRTGSPG